MIMSKLAVALLIAVVAFAASLPFATIAAPAGDVGQDETAKKPVGTEIVPEIGDPAVFTGTTRIELRKRLFGEREPKAVVLIDAAEIGRLVATIRLEEARPCECMHNETAVFTTPKRLIKVSLCDHCFDFGGKHWKMPPEFYQLFQTYVRPPSPTKPDWGEAVNGLQCRIVPETQTVVVPEGARPQDINIFVTYELRLVGDRPMMLLPWDFPFSDALGAALRLYPQFDVIGPDGKKARYWGAVVEPPPPPGKGAFERIVPGAVLSRRVRVAYEMTKPGVYRISSAQTTSADALGYYYANDAAKIKANPDSVWTGTLRSNVVTVEVVQQPDPAPRPR